MLLGTWVEFASSSNPAIGPFRLLGSIAVEYIGLGIFIFNIGASIVSRFQRRTPIPEGVSPIISPAVSPAAPPLGRQPPLG
jgi:hypothetical protein